MKHRQLVQLKRMSRLAIVVAFFVVIFGGLITAGFYVRGEYLKYSGMTNSSEDSVVTEDTQDSQDSEANIDPSAPAEAVFPPGESDEHIPAGALRPIEDFSAGDAPEPEESAAYRVEYKEGYSQPILQLGDISRNEFALENVD